MQRAVKSLIKVDDIKLFSSKVTNLNYLIYIYFVVANWLKLFCFVPLPPQQNDRVVVVFV